MPEQQGWVLMQTDDGEHDIPDVITQCLIQECQVQPDGRLAIECLAEERVSYSSTWEQDGYRMCRVKEPVHDDPEELDEEDRKLFQVCTAHHAALRVRVV